MKRLLLVLCLGLLCFVGYGQDTIYYNGFNDGWGLDSVVSSIFNMKPYYEVEHNFDRTDALHSSWDGSFDVNSINVSNYDSISLSFNLAMQDSTELYITDDMNKDTLYKVEGLPSFGGYNEEAVILPVSLKSIFTNYTKVRIHFSRPNRKDLIHAAVDNLLITGYSNDILSIYKEETIKQDEVEFIFTLGGKIVTEIVNSGVYIFWYSDGSKEKKFISIK